MRGLKFDGVDLQHHVEAGLVDARNKVSSSESTEERFDYSAPASLHPLWTALEHSAGQACFERFVFTTSGGYLGIGSSTMEPGDKVVILLGCKVPVILRPFDQGYKVIGESCVDGMMYGEMMQELGQDSSSVSIKDLEIS